MREDRSMPDPITRARRAPDPLAGCAVCRDPLPAGRPLECTQDGDGFTCSDECAEADRA